MFNASCYFSRNVEQGLRGTRSATGHYNTISRMDRHRVMDDHYSPDRDRYIRLSTIRTYYNRYLQEEGVTIKCFYPELGYFLP